MNLTAQIPHLILPDFVTTIKFFDRRATIRKQSQVMRSRRAHVVENKDGSPFLWKGEPLLAWSADLPEDFAFTSLAEYVSGWSGLKIDGIEIPFSPDNMHVLFDERLDVQIEREIDGKKTTLPQSWAMYLQDKAYERATFDSDPKTTGSAKQ